jgi:hypothetical protein
MEREKSVLPPPREIFTVADRRFNILDLLRERERLTVNADAVRPGDLEAMTFLRHLTNVGVTPTEYRTAMPKLLQYAVKEEGGKEAGFDGDFFVVAEWFIRYAQRSMGGHDVAYLPEDKRIALLANVYGKLEFLKQTIWRDPAQTDYKKGLVEHAKNVLKKESEIWSNVLSEVEDPF